MATSKEGIKRVLAETRKRQAAERRAMSGWRSK
jgi:hypothetical protein